MSNLVVFDGINKIGSSVVVKTVDDFENFKDVLLVFKNYPYNEILSDKDCMDEYESYLKNGFVFGCYIDNDIAGINCILNDVPSDYSIEFDNPLSIAYYSGLAVKEEYRGLGIGKLLVFLTQKYLEELGIYDASFARILCEGSMSEGIFKRFGFTDAYYDGRLIVDDVSYLRNDGNYRSDKRKYMVKRINDKNSFFRR